MQMLCMQAVCQAPHRVIKSMLALNGLQVTAVLGAGACPSTPHTVNKQSVPSLKKISCRHDPTKRQHIIVWQPA